MTNVHQISLSNTNPIDLLTAIVQPRDDWFGIEVIVTLIPDLLEAFETVGRPLDGAEQLQRGLEAGGYKKLTEETTQNSRGISGLISEFPINAMLFRLASQTNSPKRLELTALVLALAEEWRSDISEAEFPVYKDRIQGACRALRLLSEEGVRWIPRYKFDVEQFSEVFQSSVETLSPRRLGESQVRYLKDLERFFRYFLGDFANIERGSRGPRKPIVDLTEGRWVEKEADQDSEFHHTSDPTVFVSGVSEDAFEPHKLAGNAPAELINSTVLLNTRRRVAIDAGESTRNAIRKTGVKRAGLRRVNRVLPGRWESLNDYDLVAFLQWADANHREYPLETLLLLLVLITGRSAQAVFDARVVAKHEQLPEKIDAQSLYLIADTRAWACGILQPESRRKKRHFWEEQLSPVSDVFIVAIPGRLWQKIAEFVWAAEMRANKRSVRLFGQNRGFVIPGFSKLLAQSKECLKAVRQSSGARVTLKRLESQLFASLAEKTSDTVEASIVTGSQPPFGQSAALYYQSSPVSSLVENYQQVVESWSNVLVPAWLRGRETDLELEETFLGSPFVVRENSMRAAAAALRRQLAFLRQQKSPDAVRAFHNLYTAYTQWMLLWATGFRAVHDPVGRPYEINRRRGLVFIADKTGDGNAHHRAVPSPTQLIDQLNAYDEHVQTIRSRTYLTNTGSNPDASFYYLDESLQIHPATPGQLTNELERFFPLPLNVSRHTLRSFLRRQSVPGGLVNAFMGHWGIGTEPWSRYSSLDPMLFATSLTPLLTQLLDEIGFEVVGGINGR